MPRFEVGYKIILNSIKSGESWKQVSGAPTNYTTVVEAVHQGIATNQVIAMNGGPDHCFICYTRPA